MCTLPPFGVFFQTLVSLRTRGFELLSIRRPFYSNPSGKSAGGFENMYEFEARRPQHAPPKGPRGPQRPKRLKILISLVMNTPTKSSLRFEARLGEGDDQLSNPKV